MEIQHLPFKPGTLALAVAAVVFASQSVPGVRAADTEWDCAPTPNGQWDCDVVPKASNPIKRASVPATETNKSAPLIKALPHNQLKTQLNWVPKSKLDDRRKATLPPYACGLYVEPPRPGINFRGNIDETPIIAEANESNYDESAIATLLGDVKIRQGSRELKSESATLDRQNNYGQFSGNVTFRDSGVLLVGEKGDLQLDTGRATLEDSSYVLYEGGIRGSAQSIVHNEDGTLDLNEAVYTTCAPGESGWQLSGKTVSIDQTTGEGVARDAVVRVEGVPVLYSPWLSFPIDDRRKSGFLYPEFSQDSDNGFDFSIPYYWNIAPNYDATITPRVMSKRGVLLENEFRYLVDDNEGEIGLAGLVNKDQQKEDNAFYDKSRWIFNLRHQSQLSSRWSAELDYAKASDKNYLSDFGSELEFSNRGPLNQKVGTRYEGGDNSHSWQARLDVHKFQNMSRTADDPYNKLPQLELTGNWHVSDRVDLNYVADYTKFSRDKGWNYLHEERVNGIYESIYDDGYGIKKVNGERMYLESGLSLPMENSFGYLTPAFKVQHVQYQLSNINKDEVVKDLGNAYGDSFKSGDFTKTPQTTVPVVSIDAGMYFDRFTDIGNTSFTHTLEPRIKYLYSPYVEGQEMNPVFDTSTLVFSYGSLWRDSRFSGYDRLGDANQISLGLGSRLLEDDGFERVRFGIGQIIYLKDRSLWINPTAGNNPAEEEDWQDNVVDEETRLREEMEEGTSPLAAELVYNINRSMNIRQDLAWNTNKNDLDTYGVYFGYRPDDRRVINAGYRYRSQVDRYLKNEDDTNISDPSNPDSFLKADNNYSQTDLSFAWPVYNNWSAMGRWQYDFTNRRNLELLSGVEYNSCCYQVRVLWRQWVDQDDTNIDHAKTKSGVFLQFVLRGLGDLAGGSIKEYHQRLCTG